MGFAASFVAGRVNGDPTLAGGQRLEKIGAPV
jgi:hypothetical protein